MTEVRRPDFLDSPYFVNEQDNWHLKNGAPQEVIDEFNQYMESTKELELVTLSMPKKLNISDRVLTKTLGKVDTDGD